MKLAERTTRIVPSPTLQITAKAKSLAAQGVDVIDFSAGELACDTPDFIKSAAEAALRSGFTKYTPVGGTDELKEAIIDKLKQDQGLQYEKAQILVSCGAKHSLYNIAQALLQAGDEVIVPTPYWVSYPDIIRLADATPVFLPTEEARKYAIDPVQLESLITPRTKALILNSPCNPTGATYDRATLEHVANVALRHKLTVISDEIYEKIVYDGLAHTSIASLGPELQKQTIVVNGVSKAFSMTGWRIGYAAGPKEIITAMTHIQSQSTSNPTSISQKATVAALRGGTGFFAQIVDDLEPKRRVIVEQLNKIPGITCPLPSGAFYAFPNVSQLLGRKHAQRTIATASDLATYLLDEAHLACVPGEPFGSGEHARFSYTPRLETIQRGMDRLQTAIHALSESIDSVPDSA